VYSRFTVYVCLLAGTGGAQAPNNSFDRFTAATPAPYELRIVPRRTEAKVSLYSLTHKPPRKARRALG
jgi:hypothetical protein